MRGNESQLRRQQIVVYGLFQLPFGHNKALLGNAKGIINQLVSGYEINPVVNYSSGLPFTITSNQSATWIPNSAPGYVNGNARNFHKQVSGTPNGGLTWYPAASLSNNPYGFTAPALDTIGSEGRDQEFGPHLFNTDLSIQKNFQIKESIAFQLRADGLNAFNHINWGTPNGTLESGGTITGGPFPNGANPRQMVFSGRLNF